MSVLYTNTFGNETLNQPPADTTQRWSTANITTRAVTEPSGTFIDDRAFTVTTGSGGTDRVTSFDAANGTLDSYIESRFRLTNIGGGGASASLILRGSGTGTGIFNGSTAGYYVLILTDQSPTELRLLRLDDGGENSDIVVQGGPAQFAASQGDFLNLRLQAVNQNGETLVQLFASLNANPIPETALWQYQDNDPLPAGWAGVGVRHTGTTIDFDTVEIGTVEDDDLPVPSNRLAEPAPGNEQTHIRVSFDHVEDATKYQVRMDPDEFDPELGEGTLILDGPGTTDGGRRYVDVEDPDLQDPPNEYFFSVKAIEEE